VVLSLPQKYYANAISCLLRANNYCKFYYSSMWNCRVLVGPILKAQLAILRLHQIMKPFHCPPEVGSIKRQSNS